MKKSAILLGIALSLGFASCNEFDLPNPPGQSNPEVAVFNTDNLVLEQAAETLDLQAAKEAGSAVTLANITKLVDFPEAYDLLIEADFATKADFSDAVTVTTLINDDLVQLEASDINNVIYNNFTKDPQDITLHARMAAYATRGTTTKQRLGGADYYYAADYTYLTIPFTPEKVIENSYYLLQRAIGATSWDVTAALPFTHTSEASVYDNPVFSIKIDVDANGTEWAVLPGSSFDAANLDGILGVQDSTLDEGYLEGGENIVAGVIKQESPYTISIDMMADSYKIALAFDYLWVPGQGSSSTNFNNVLRLTTKNYVNYEGVAFLRGSWYLTGQPSNTGVVYTLGQEPAEQPVVDPKTGVETGKIVNDSKGQKMSASDKGLYYIQANLSLLTYTRTPIQSISAIGEFNGWNTETAPDLTANGSKMLEWTIKDLEMPEGSQFKFCVNHAWTLSFGGAYDNLEQNGDNLTVPGQGGADAKTEKFDITINFSTLPYTCTITKK